MLFVSKQRNFPIIFPCVRVCVCFHTLRLIQSSFPLLTETFFCLVASPGGWWWWWGSQGRRRVFCFFFVPLSLLFIHSFGQGDSLNGPAPLRRVQRVCVGVGGLVDNGGGDRTRQQRKLQYHPTRGERERRRTQHSLQGTNDVYRGRGTISRY